MSDSVVVATVCDIPLQSALAYAALGWKVLPLSPRTKTPATPRGYHEATDDIAQIRKWWGAKPRLGVGVSCGASGLLVLDVQGPEGEATLRALESRLGPIPRTVTARTGGGNRLLFLTCPDGLRRVRLNLGAGLTLRHYGHVVLPPSIHPSGNRYTWEISPSDEAVGSLPDDWEPELVATAPIGAICDSTAWGLAVLEGEISHVRNAPPGGKVAAFGQAAYIAGQLEAGLEVTAGDTALYLGQLLCEVPLSQLAAERLIADNVRSGRSAPRSAPKSAEVEDGEPEWAGSIVWKVLRSGERRPEKSVGNLALLLARHAGWEGCLAYNELTHQPCWIRSPPALPGLPTPTGRLRDPHAVYIRQWFLIHHHVEFTKDTAFDAIGLAADANRVHPVQRYLESLEWDGVPRVVTWLIRYMGAPDTQTATGLWYTRTVGRWWMISAVARAMHPGCQVDHVLIMEGPKQGEGKSSALRILAGEWLQSKLGPLESKDGPQSLLGSWIVEIGELDAFRGKAATAIKDFVTRTIDNFRPSYGRMNVEIPRSCVFAGTTNDMRYLEDSSGARRFWPVRVEALDEPALRRDVDQLWAEAFHLYRQGERWWPITKDEREMCGEVAEERQVNDPWEQPIIEVLNSPAHATTNYWSGKDILATCIKMETEHMDRRAEMRISAFMQRHGWERHRMTPQGRPRGHYYVRPDTMSAGGR